jgi:signal peptidase I
MAKSRPRRKVVWVLGAVLVFLVVFGVLWSVDLLIPVVGGRGASMAPTLPACNGRTLGEGFTYHFRDPRRGEIVIIHARGELGGAITPDPDARDLNLSKRVIGIPGDTVVGRNGRVFVNGEQADDFPTEPFPVVHLGPKQYYVLGDNRAVSQDSRAFGPVPRNTIFGRVFLIYWPFGRFGVPGYDKNAVPPGEVAC